MTTDLFHIGVPDGWSTIRYDTSEFYHSANRRRRNLSGVDFIVVSPERTVYIIERKDYCSDQEKWAAACRSGSLLDKVVRQYEHAILGLFGAYRCANADLHQAAASVFASPSTCVKVLLILDYPSAIGPERDRIARDHLSRKLEQKLSYLQVDIRVCSLAEVKKQVPWRFANVETLA